jgi:copper chaperone CopZ
MMRATFCAVVMAFWLAVAAQAQTPAFSKMTLTELDCGHCAKKVAKGVVAVAGVAEVRYDLKTKAQWAIHKPGQTPSPRALWEAVERAEHEVQRLETPAGTHTSKPAI